MIRCLTREKRGKRGFTMMEVLVVVGIIAVIAAIAIPSVISMRKNMDYKQRCDYAKTIFLAAQSNLADLRSTGELKSVELSSDEFNAKIQHGDVETIEKENEKIEGNLPAGFTSRYDFTSNKMIPSDVRFDRVLPVNSVESVIRDQNVIIEYNPRTGIVHAVFYAEGNYDLLGKYKNKELERNDQWLKDNQVGYYSMGNADISEELGFKTVSPKIEFTNDQEAILTVKVPTRTTESTDKVFFEPSQYGYYVKGLEINLTVAGENSGVFTMNLKKSGEEMHFKGFDEVEGAALVIPLDFTLDSLVDGKGFYDIPENKDGEGYHVLPGDNISLFVEVSYVPTSQNDPLIMYDDAVLAGVNPLFHSVTGEIVRKQDGLENQEKGNATIAISNGRHLQNLNALHSDIADSVKTITFLGETKSETTEDGKTVDTTSAPVVDWKDTVRYYQKNHTSENLKDFVPIENNGLFNRGTQNSLLIKGDNTVISNLKISDATLEKYVGLFRTLNGVILENLRIVDPVIRGGSNSEAVGALAGSIQNSKVTNCYVYADVSQDGFEWSHLDNSDDFADRNSEQLIGVKGSTAVGGMVGYSDNTTFTKSFASVPVYGDMTKPGANGHDFGVGGFAGVSDLSTFNICYTGARTLGVGATDGQLGTGSKINSSCGIGGFVGTSVDAEYNNCFASGNVTSVSGSSQTLEAVGGFVGVAIDNGTKGNGIFDTCYSLGSVKCSELGGNRQAKFVGCNYTSEITDNSQVDFYKQLLKGMSRYTYKDCYYLYGIERTTAVDKCTLPATYDMLHDLCIAGYNDGDDGRIEFILASLRHTNETLLKKTLENNATFKTAMADFDFHGDWTQGQYIKGHYAYNEQYFAHKTNYPYMMQNVVDFPFYGFWPDAPSDVGMAYMEFYADENTPYGIYYEPLEVNTLQNKKVVGDRYIILSAKNSGNHDVYFNGLNSEHSRTLDFGNFVSLKDEDGFVHEYSVAFVPEDIKLYGDAFYSTAVMEDGVNTYAMYFNPNVALSQGNYTGSSVSQEKLQELAQYVPEQIIIRSPRQFNALSSDDMAKFMDENYVLQGDLDFAFYEDYLGKAYQMEPIEEFSGTLTGVSDPVITVKNAESGLIEVLSGGEVSGITVTGTMELGNNEGALVNVMNGGTLKDCAVNAVITSNSETAGLVVGALNGGKISNCTFDDTGISAQVFTSDHLGFVGTAVPADATPVNENANYFTITAFEGSSIAEDKIADTFKEVAAGTTKRAYAAEIDKDCFFTVNGETTPAVKTAVYYYSISEDEEYKKSDTPAPEFAAVSSVKPSEFGTGNTQWKSTGYYFMKDNKYYPVSVIVTAVEKPVSQPSVVADTDGTDSGESTQESTGATEPPAPQTKTVYTYEFGYNNETLYTASDIENPETAITLPADLPLYTLNMPMKGKTYILVNLTGGALKADDNSKVVQKNSDITEDVVWTVGADGVWFNNKETEKKITVTLGNVANGAEQHPMMKVGNIDYNVYAVSENTERNVELVDRDCEYVTTESLASKPETT